MVRGMDERFDDPSEEDNGELEDSDGTVEETSEAERDDSEVESADQKQSGQQSSATTGDTSPEEKPETDKEPLNIREDWDSATMYVEPEQSEDIEVTFTRLKKQLKRENVTLEKKQALLSRNFRSSIQRTPRRDKRKDSGIGKKETD
jgi:hypothetical protein